MFVIINFVEHVKQMLLLNDDFHKILFTYAKHFCSSHFRRLCYSVLDTPCWSLLSSSLLWISLGHTISCVLLKLINMSEFHSIAKCLVFDLVIKSTNLTLAFYKQKRNNPDHER